MPSLRPSSNELNQALEQMRLMADPAKTFRERMRKERKLAIQSNCEQPITFFGEVLAVAIESDLLKCQCTLKVRAAG
jgi:hypothetical protein